MYRAPRNSMLFVRRAPHLRRQPNQIAFPGGVADEGDAGDPLTTALREFTEELGVLGDRLTIVARLPDRNAISAAFTLTPFVGVLESAEALRPDASEVAEVIEVPLAAIFAEGAVHRGETDLGDRVVTSWQFDYGMMHVWGATGHILQTLVTAIRENAGGLRQRIVTAGVELPQPLQALHGG
jgi:8-oxo-dGTP pyrophosphatase MutT (NUDIX family)